MDTDDFDIMSTMLLEGLPNTLYFNYQRPKTEVKEG